MDPIKLETLMDIGLTKNEAKVYLALLKLGSATVVEITKQSKVHRVNVYDALERLRTKGLISTIIHAKKRIYEAADPKQLTALIKQKEELLSQIMPRLEQDYKLKKVKQQVHHFFGPDGILRAYYMMLDQGKTLYGMGGSGLNRKYLKHRHAMFTKDRLKRKIPVKALYYESARKKNIEADQLIEIKYLPDEFKSDCMVDIAGDIIVNLFPIEDNIMAIVIENATLAQTFRNWFKFMWKFAKR